MAVEEKKLRRLTIKAYHMDTVVMGDRNDITTGGKMTVCKDIIPDLLKDAKYIKDIDIQVIQPGEHDRWTNTIMDIIPISTKVLGVLGEGITHTITGVYVMLTDVVRPGGKRVLIIKQVAGQGAMYDTHMFPKEPSSSEGTKSIIDMENMPVMITPNEYRDGIIRSMQ